MQTNEMPVICRGSLKVLGRDERNGFLYAVETAENRFGILKHRETINVKVYAGLLRCRHEHICRIYDYWKQKDGYYIFEEYVSGSTLGEAAARGLGRWEAVDLMLQLLDGLHFLHTASPEIIHRDLSMSNVMVDELGRVRIVDFGAARVCNMAEGQDTCLLGTPGFAAPEQFGFGKTDVRTDIYSAGVLMRRLGLDRGPYAQVIERATSIAPDRRYQDVRQMAKNIRAIQKIGLAVGGFHKKRRRL